MSKDKNSMSSLEKENMERLKDYKQKNLLLAQNLFIHQKPSPYYSDEAEKIKEIVNSNLLNKVNEISGFVKKSFRNTDKKDNINKIEQYIYYLCLKSGLNGEQLMSLDISNLTKEQKIGMLNTLIEKEINLETTKTQKIVADYKKLQTDLNNMLLTESSERLLLRFNKELENFKETFSEKLSQVPNLSENNNIRLDFSETSSFLEEEINKYPKITKKIRNQLIEKIEKQLNSQFYRKYRILTKQIGFAFEDQVSQDLKNQEDLILNIKEKSYAITEKSGTGKVTGFSKHSRTRKVDMNLLVPEIEIKPQEEKIKFTGNYISIQHSIKRTQSDKTEIHFHTAKNLEHLISFLIDNCYKNKEIKNFLEELRFENDPYYSYFLINDLFTTRRIDGTVFLKNFRKMLASFGPIYALSTLTKSITTSNGEVDDSIDIVLANNKLIPAVTLFSLYAKTLEEKGSAFNMGVEIPKGDISDLQYDGDKRNAPSPPPYYQNNYLSQSFDRRKQYLNNIEFSAKLTESFRQKINDYIYDCIGQYQHSYTFKQLNNILKEVNNG